ncbi:restriction endonuclease [Halorussus halophilus]|uniref:restriction endonuclease n=1 Tax=Halorussus halophilus TaxID=2650975 RepID=UPI00130175DC|nr:restriction endonuclease [Halorussus halophilus]
MTSEFLKEKLRSIPPDEFEQFVADVWAQYGYQTEVTPPGKDRGVDVWASREFPYPRTEVIQVKRYAQENPVSSPDVQQYSALRKQENADLALIVTTSRFTSEAKEIASDLGVEILDAHRLVATVSTDNHYRLLAEYAPINDTAGHRLSLEPMADELVESTGLEDPVAVRDLLYSFFDSHPPKPSIGKQATLHAFTKQDGWDQTTRVRWDSKPSLSAPEIADALLRDADQFKRGSPTTKNVALRAAISKILDEQIRPSPAEMSASELAEWFIETFDEEQIPAVLEYPTDACESAEKIIDTTDSVAVNRLRVAEKLEQAY